VSDLIIIKWVWSNINFSQTELWSH